MATLKEVAAELREISRAYEAMDDMEVGEVHLVIWADNREDFVNKLRLPFGSEKKFNKYGDSQYSSVFVSSEVGPVKIEVHGWLRDVADEVPVEAPKYKIDPRIEEACK